MSTRIYSVSCKDAHLCSKGVKLYRKSLHFVGQPHSRPQCDALTRRIETQQWRRRFSHGAYLKLPGVSDDDDDDDDDDDADDGDDDAMAEAVDLALAPELVDNQL